MSLLSRIGSFEGRGPVDRRRAILEGQVALPKAVGDVAGIVRVRPEGGVIVEAEAAVKRAGAYNSTGRDGPSPANSRIF